MHDAIKFVKKVNKDKHWLSEKFRINAKTPVPYIEGEMYYNSEYKVYVKWEGGKFVIPEQQALF